MNQTGAFEEELAEKGRQTDLILQILDEDTDRFCEWPRNRDI